MILVKIRCALETVAVLLGRYDHRRGAALWKRALEFSSAQEIVSGGKLQTGQSSVSRRNCSQRQRLVRVDDPEIANAKDEASAAGRVGSAPQKRAGAMRSAGCYAYRNEKVGEE